MSVYGQERYFCSGLQHKLGDWGLGIGPLPHSIPDFLFCDDWFCPLSIRQQYPTREGE
ncbi:hypothetical protein [Anabaena sp. YBS01]|uniref:hypothetical protein n=1 Tax=Anabaena sp. YBS01 TaxID=2490939 RepID=UPI0012938836|nr:hypothetical protein [Anabaena sp. YBS01]